MLTKLDYKMYNYKKLATLLTMSLIHCYFFKTPCISNYNSDLLHQNDLKESIISIIGINVFLLMLEIIAMYLFLTLIQENVLLYNDYKSISLNEVAFCCTLCNIKYLDNRLDFSNPFLYSNKVENLRE